MTDTFPRQYARTRRFTLGEPRDIVVSPDGARVVYARSAAGDDPVNALWVMDAQTGAERLVADPRVLLADAGESGLPPEERARRERTRESAGGITGFATDAAVVAAAFALGGRLFVGGLVSASSRELQVVGPVFDPRPDPKAQRVAYVSGRALRVAELDGRSSVIAEDDDPDVTWGSADFIAAEEMDRERGFWWSPDGDFIVATRVDTSPVRRWWIADPAQPETAPTEVAYPAAGTDNAIVTLHVLSLNGQRVDVDWDRNEFPYVANVVWPRGGALVAIVQSRDQRRLQVLGVDHESGRTTVIFDDFDDAWVDLVPGTPGLLDDGRLVMTADRDGSRRLLVAGRTVTEPELEVRTVVATAGDDVVFTANPVDDATEIQVWRWTPEAGPQRITSAVGVHGAAVGGTTIVLRSSTLDADGTVTRLVDGPIVPSFAETPLVKPRVALHRLGDQGIATALLLPDDADPDVPLPVLLDPYGGPGAQRVVAARSAYLSSQWFADQGFAVVVADGRGTPGRGHAWERAVRGDLAGPVLDDQVAALQALAAEDRRLDLSRVAIRGWSFGGYLAALAVLRRPDVFHAAVAGAPVTEWRLYDTHYTERYLGDPDDDAAAYDRSSLIPDAGRLERPLLLIHGLADDNVVAAHTLQFSSALLAAGKPHRVLPLSGVTHMTPQEVVAENLLLLQLAFIREALGITAPDDA